MFKKKKSITDYDYITGYVEGTIDAINVLKLQAQQYGEIANINDLIKLIDNNADKNVDKLFENK